MRGRIVPKEAVLIVAGTFVAIILKAEIILRGVSRSNVDQYSSLSFIFSVINLASFFYLARERNDMK
jgi:hypothetical protein